MAYVLSNGHVTDDVSWPWKVTLVTPIPLERNILKMASYRDSVPKDYQYQMAYGPSNGHLTDDVTWPPIVLWGSTVGYLSDSLTSCLRTNTVVIVDGVALNTGGYEISGIFGQ